MKNKYLLNLILCIMASVFAQSVYGQAGDYSFATSTVTYTSLGASATNLPVLEDDDVEDTVSLGFTFFFEGSPYTDAYVSSNGILSFNPNIFSAAASTIRTNNLASISAGLRPLVAPLWDDLDGGNATTSSASYQTSGTSPNRVFTMEWKDWSWDYYTSAAVVSFQVKLYETTNEVQFHYDLVDFTSITFPSASIGLSGASSFLSVYDTSAIPVVSKLTEYTQIDSVVTGRVFSFIPPSCAAPSSGVFSFVNVDSVQFNFFSSTTAGSFDIEYGPAGFTQGTNTNNIFNVTDTLANIGALASGTAYDVYVRLDCGGGSLSSWAGPYTFITKCFPYNAPFTENFNGAGWVSGTGSTNAGDTIGNCWSRSDDATGHFWGVMNGPTNSSNTGPSVDFNGSGNYIYTETSSGATGDTTYLVSPFINISSLNTPFLSFYYHLYGATMGNLYVEVNDGSGWKNNLFNLIGSQQSSSTQLWVRGFVDLSVLTLTSDTIQVRFVGVRGTSNTSDMAIDQFSVTEAPTCFEPLTISGAVISRDSVVVNWDSANTAYNVIYGPTGFGLVGGTTVSVTDTFVGIGGLLSNTTYDFYVLSDCSNSGNGLSIPTGPIIMTTLCDALSVPFTETFNSNSTTEDCWMVLDLNNDGDAWNLDYGSNPLNGDQVAMIYTDYNSGSNNDWLISPPLNFSGNEQLAYYYRVQSSGEPNDFEVLVSTTGVNPADFIDTIVPFASYSNTTYNRETIDMSAFTGATYIAWHVPPGGLDGWRIYIDSVVVEALPSCPDPTQLTASNISAFQANLSWTNPNATAWNIEIVPVGFGQGSGTVVPITSNPYPATGLAQNTCYDYYVQRDCGGNLTSQWSGPFTFCTPPTCPSPTNLGVDPNSVTLNSASIYFTPSVASNFNIEYGVTGFTFGTGTNLQATNDTVGLSGLSSETEYEFYVRDSCSATDTSTWSGPFSFVTSFTTNYLEDFNSGTAPFGWQEADGRLTQNTIFTASSSSWTANTTFGNVTGSSPSRSVNIYQGSQYEWAISPSIYLDPTTPNLQVEFDALINEWISTTQGYLNGSDDTLALVISTDNGVTWSNSNIIWYSDANDSLLIPGEHVIVPLSAYSGYVRFGFYAGSAIDDSPDNDWFIDNFEVRTPRACNTPVLDSITAITTTSATVNWTNGDVTGSSWDVILTTGSQAPNGGIVSTVTTSGNFTFNTLMHSTSYCVYLVETCANGISDTTGPLCFSTQCLSSSLPYIESFTTSLGCFDAINGGNTSDTWNWVANYVDFFGLTYTLDGSSGFALVDDDAPGAAAALDNELLESIIIDASSATGPVILEFDHYYENVGDDSVAVDVFDGTTWNRVLGYTTTQGLWGAPAHDSIDISAYASANMQVRFRYHDGGEYAWYWAVDNIEVYEASGCGAPNSLDTASVDCDAASLVWNSQSSTVSSMVEYGQAGFALGAGTNNPNATSPYPITGLAPSTSYEFYVKDVCAAPDSSVWSGPFAFTTDAPPAITAAFSSTQTTTTLTSATVDFDASISTGATAYAWDFGNGQTSTGVNATAMYSKDSSYTVCLAITGACGAVDTVCNTISVQGINLEENAFSAILTLFPNPSKGAFNLNVGNTNKRFSIEIADLSGRIIYKATDLASNVDHIINVSSEAAGLYMLNIKGEGLLMNRRIVIEK